MSTKRNPPNPWLWEMLRYPEYYDTVGVANAWLNLVFRFSGDPPNDRIRELDRLRKLQAFYRQQKYPTNPMKNEQLIGAAKERKAILAYLRRMGEGTHIMVGVLMEWLKGRHDRYSKRPGQLRPRGGK